MQEKRGGIRSRKKVVQPATLFIENRLSHSQPTVSAADGDVFGSCTTMTSPKVDVGVSEDDEGINKMYAT